MSYAYASPGVLQRRSRSGLGLLPSQQPATAMINGKVVQLGVTTAQYNAMSAGQKAALVAAKTPAIAPPAAPKPVATVAPKPPATPAAPAQNNYVAAAPAAVTPQKAPVQTAVVQKAPAVTPSAPVVVPPKPVGVQSSYDAITNSWIVLSSAPAQTPAPAPAPAALPVQNNYVAAAPSVVTPQSAPAQTAVVQKAPVVTPSAPVVVPPKPVGVQSSYDAITNSWIILSSAPAPAPVPAPAPAPAPAVLPVQNNYVAAAPSVVTPQSAPAQIMATQSAQVAAPSAPKPVGVQSSYDAITNSWTVLNGPVGSQPFGTGTGSSPAPDYAGTPVNNKGDVVYLMQGPTGPVLAGGVPTLDANGNPQIYSYDPALKDQYLSPQGVTSQAPSVSLTDIAAAMQIPNAGQIKSLTDIANVNPAVPIPGVTSLSDNGTKLTTIPDNPNYVTAPPSQVTPPASTTPPVSTTPTPVTNVPPGVPITAPECPYLPGCPGYPGTSGGGATDVSTGAASGAVGTPTVSCPSPPVCLPGQSLTIDANGCYSLCSGDATSGNWFTDATQDVIPGVSNWMLVSAAALAAYVMFRKGRAR